MPRYVKDYLHQFGHKTPIKTHHQPYPAQERTYGTDAQKMKLLDTSLALPTERVKIIERIIRKFLYYVRVVDNTCLFLLSTTETIN